MSDEKPRPYKINHHDMAWTSYAAPRGHFGSEDKDLTDEVTAKRLSVCLTRLAPGIVSCPYHFHHVGEEFFIIQEGTGTLRYAGETSRVGPGDVISCPAGPGGAHQFINDGDVPLVYLAISTVEAHEIAEYPDSGKVMAYVKSPAGNMFGVFRQADKVDYWDGEPGAGEPTS